MQAGGAIGRRNYSFLTSPTSQQPAFTDWALIYDDPSKPLVVDLGCGAGRYILLMALRKGPSRNYLGLDVHKALLDRANGWAAARSLAGNVHYMQANAVLSSASLLGSYPGRVELVSIQYPDPQQRRQRHIVGRELVEALAAVLESGARVYLTSDFEDTATYMRNAFERYGSSSFRIDDIHSTHPVFPCTQLSPPTAAAGGRSAGGTGAGGNVDTGSRPPDCWGPDDSSRHAGSVAPGSSPSCGGNANGDDEQRPTSANVQGAPEAGGVLDSAGGSGGDDDLLWYQGSWQQAGWLVNNPVGAPTEREVYVEKATMGRVFRVLLVRR